MLLSEKQIFAEIEKPSKSKEIALAKLQQDRIKFHAETNAEVINSKPLTDFKNFVKSILPADKYELTIGLLKFPLPTNEVCESIFTKLAKIHDGRNPAFSYQFHNTQERDDWEYYRQEVLHEPDVWSEKAWEFFKTEINSIVVVDMPEVEDTSDKYPQPYFYFVPIDKVISYSVNKLTDAMDWVIFRSGDKIIVIDGESYRTYSTREDKSIGTLLSNNPHRLGYCPSRFFWNQSLTLSQPDIKKSPISKVLSDLDWYLFYCLAKKHLDIYGSYPIYSGYEQECDYTNEQGDTCQKGYLIGLDGHYRTDEMGRLVPCPLCHGKKNLAGPGTYVEIPVPHGDEADLRNPVQILSIDKNSLNYNVEELNRIKQNIINSCVGTDNTILNETSLADKQVDASFESQNIVLKSVKKGFESLQTWVDNTACLLRYRDAFISGKVNYGSEFYTLTTEVLQARYTKAKEAGASMAELDALKQQAIETEYHHNPIMLQRMIILSDIEPYRHMSQDEMLTLFDKGIVSAGELALKSDFMGYIARFERENDNILEFGSQMEYAKKIETIYNTILSYAEQRINQGLGQE